MYDGCCCGAAVAAPIGGTECGAYPLLAVEAGLVGGRMVYGGYPGYCPGGCDVL